MTFLPELTTIRQRFSDEKLTDIPGTLRGQLDGSGVTLRPGMQVAIAVGSRGIANLRDIVKETVGWVKARGTQPFLVPAMGSHGGATAEGQRAVLEGYGVTEEYAGAPIRSSMEVIELPRGDVEVPVYMDAFAAQADGVILINRVKPHTSFHGRYESGLLKMLAIGLGKHRQAQAIHRHGVAGLREIMPRVAKQILREGHILLGIGIVENAFDETLRIRAIPAQEIPACEPELLALARRHMPRLPIEEIDLLIVDEMGKDISGLGMDPNIIGRLKIAGSPEPESPRIRVIIARDLTDGSHGNATGMGLADIILRRAVDKIDFAATYANVLTTGFLERGKLPLVAETDAQALQMAMAAWGPINPEDARILRIKNTLHLEELQVSPPVLAALQRRTDIDIVNPSDAIFHWDAPAFDD
ncbi:MAG: nickel pincer cofactor-dependent isomerase, group 22 [Armatimonadota bacterium]